MSKKSSVSQLSELTVKKGWKKVMIRFGQKKFL